jgi:hypothetical protein
LVADGRVEIGQQSDIHADVEAGSHYVNGYRALPRVVCGKRWIAQGVVVGSANNVISIHALNYTARRASDAAVTIA